MFARLGLAIVQPLRALALAGDRKHAGRSGSDLLAAIGMLVIATQLRALIAAFWLGSAVSWGLCGRAIVQLLQGVLTIDLGVLVISAGLVFAASGRRREVGRAFDLACVAVLPLVYVQLVVLVLAHVLELAIPPALAYAPPLAWTGALVALAALEGRRGGAKVPGAVPRAGLLAGLVIAAVAAIGGWSQVWWVVHHVEYVRPLTRGLAAPPFALPRIMRKGMLGPPVALADHKGQVVVVDFWATWCKPCLQSMPHLDALARAHPDAAVIAVNIDDAEAAWTLFDDRNYAMTLVADDGDASQRYGVSAIPHTVVIDRAGVVRVVSRGGDADLDAAVAQLSGDRQ